MATKGKGERRSCACGNPDQDKLATCSKCGAQEHIYCMLIPPRVVPKVWQCGDCIAFRAAPSTTAHKFVPSIRKDSSQSKVKLINHEEASRLHGRRWCGPSVHKARLKIPPNKKPCAYKGNEFASRLQKVSPEPAKKVRRTSSPPSEFSNKKPYAYQRNELYSGSQKVSPQPSPKMRRNDSPPSWFLKPLDTGNNVNLPSDQALKDRKDERLEDPIVRQIAEKALVHESGADLPNMIKEDPVEEESPKSVPPGYISPDVLAQISMEHLSKGTPTEGDLLQEESEASAWKAGKDVYGVSHDFQQLGNLVTPNCSPSTISNGTPMERDLLQEESEASAWKAGKEVYGVSHDFQQLGNLVSPNCSSSTIANPPPRTTNFPPLLSETATWTGMFTFTDPAIPGDCYGMLAYPPTMVQRKACEYSAYLDEKLLVDLVPLSGLSRYLPPRDSWNYRDIALYIIPDCTKSRSVQAYHRLLQVMLKQEVAMKISVDCGVELLIFTSEHLHLDTKGWSDRVYLWAFFYDGTTCIQCDVV